MGLSFDKLLEPYTDGGTENSPVTRTLGTITSKLMISNRMPPDVVGAAIYKVFYKMAHDGLEFKGNGKYGSKGAELFSCIKAQCIEMTKHKTSSEVIQKITEMTACTRDCRFRRKYLEKQTKWAKVKSFWTEPRESYVYCGFWVIFLTVISGLVWRYIAG